MIEAVAVIAGLAYATANIGLLVSLHFKLGSLCAQTKAHGDRLDSHARRLRDLEARHAG